MFCALVPCSTCLYTNILKEAVGLIAALRKATIFIMFVKRITRQSLVVGAPAKVNLFLQVLNRRPDGYHNINSLFQAVTLFDRLTLTLSDQPEARIQTPDPAVPTGADNLITKAWRLLQTRFGQTAGVVVRLEKNIPMGGGLGGGSADAAATLLAGNLLLDLGLSNAQLRELGAEIGSDVPFFFTGGQALVMGRGEVLEETEYPVDYWVVLVTPGLAISTAASYASLNLALTESKNPFRLQACRTARELFSQLRQSGNDFEEQHCQNYPVLGRIRQTLVGLNASLVRMSGSGSTIFGLFEHAPDVESGIFASESEWVVNVVRPVTLPRL